MISKIKSFLSILLILLFNLPVYAAPSGGSVVHGQAEITHNGSNTTINQGSNSAIINWDSFDINKGESVHFNQNSSSSVVLNRVTSGIPTNIFGNLSANGNVFVLNQAGVLVGNGASINTHSFLAGAASINDKDFINGRYNFYNASGSVINNGNIKVQNGGYAVLLGKNVENNGLITAKLGKIYLSSGETFRLDMSGRDLIGVAIEKGSDTSTTKNNGKLHAEGGIVVMTAKNASNIIRQAVNNTGVIDASSISYKGGKVILGAENAEVLNSGEINVSSQTESAGSINVKGEKVVNSGLLSADGLNGGNINLYADKLLQIYNSSIIQANAFGYGNGGNIYLISPGRAESYYGAKIEANSIYGKGGFIELSGHKSVYAFSDFNTKSIFGSYGVFLLDPSDMFIGNYAELKEKENNKVSDDGKTYVDIKWLNNMLSKSNVSLKTLKGNGKGDITLNSGAAVTASNGLTLNAANDIHLLGTIDIGDLILKAGNDISGNNAVNVAGNIDIMSSNGNIQLTKLNIKGISKYSAVKGNVSLVGDNIGVINQIRGKTVGVEVTSETSLIGDNTVDKRANIVGDEISLKSAGDILVSVDTKNLSAESKKMLDISNFTREEVVLMKYLGSSDSKYSQIYGKINLTNTPQGVLSDGLSIESEYGTIFAENRLDDIKKMNIKLDANIIHFKENKSNVLNVDNSLIIGTAHKYVFENQGDITVDIQGDISNMPLTRSGLSVISRKGKVKTITPINARFFSAEAYGDIFVESSLLGGISLISKNGNIKFTSGILNIPDVTKPNKTVGNINIPDIPGLPEIPDIEIPDIEIPDTIDTDVIVRGLKALNGTIDVTLKGAGNLYISDAASKNPIKINLNSADIVSISGSGERALNLDIKNGVKNAYTLDLANNQDIIVKTNNKNYKELMLKTSGTIDYADLSQVTVTDKIHLEADNVKGNKAVTLKSGNEIFLDIKNDSSKFILDTKFIDLNGGNLNIELTKDSTLKDLNSDKLAGNIYGELNLTSKNKITLLGTLYAKEINLSTKQFIFGTLPDQNVKETIGIINGGKITLVSTDDIRGIGKISGDNVNITSNRIGFDAPLLVLANYASFTSTANKTKPSDTLINVNNNNWIYGYRTYYFNTSGQGKSFIGGRLVNYAVNQGFRDALTYGKLPIEDSNIDKVDGDYLIESTRKISNKELITVEKIQVEKISHINKKNKHIELK